jgi:AcrR family transcriptional regulator
MSRFGFRRMTMEDLAREARVSRRTIYQHFASKEDVGLSSIARVVGRVHDEIGAIAAGGGTPRGRLSRMLARRVLGRVEGVQDYIWSMDELFEAVRPAYIERRRQHFEREVEILARVLAEGRKSGDFVFEGDAASIASTLILATNAFIPYSLSPKELGEIGGIEKRLGQMSEVLLRGLEPRKEPRL